MRPFQKFSIRSKHWFNEGGSTVCLGKWWFQSIEVINHPLDVIQKQIPVWRDHQSIMGVLRSVVLSTIVHRQQSLVKKGQTRSKSYSVSQSHLWKPKLLNTVELSFLGSAPRYCPKNVCSAEAKRMVFLHKLHLTLQRSAVGEIGVIEKPVFRQHFL